MKKFEIWLESSLFCVAFMSSSTLNLVIWDRLPRLSNRMLHSEYKKTQASIQVNLVIS